MRLPFLQMESDLIAHGAAEVSHLAGCSIPQALGHIAMVRAWVVSHATDNAPPDGMVPGEAAGRRIEAAAQWSGERGALLQALLDAGQVRAEAGGVRVLHLEPYVKAWEQNRKAKDRLARHRERNANVRVANGEHAADGGVSETLPDRSDGVRSAKFAGQTQTQREDVEEKPFPASQGAAAAAPADDLPDATDHAEEADTPPARPALVLEAQTTGRKSRTPSAAENLYATLEADREKRCREAGEPYVSERLAAARQNVLFGPVVKGTDEEQGRFAAAWEAYLADPRKGEARVPWSIALFMHGGVRAEYETRALREGAA